MNAIAAKSAKVAPLLSPDKDVKLSDVKSAVIADRYFTINEKSGELHITRVVLDRPRTIILFMDSEGLMIKAPRYKNICTTSFFDFGEDEIRLTRNKDTIEIFVSRLKKIGIWHHIKNKNFFFINNNNRKLNQNKTSHTKAMTLMNNIKR